MSFAKSLEHRARKKKKRIIFTEASDCRVLLAADYLAKHEIVLPQLLGNQQRIKQYADELDVDLSKIEIFDLSLKQNNDFIIDQYLANSEDKTRSKTQAESRLLNNPLLAGAILVKAGGADGMVAGSITCTSDVIRAAITGIGLRKNRNLVSGSFIMISPEGDQVYTFGDCAVVPTPDAGDLAEIAIDTAHTHKKLVGTKPKVALLSFSTLGSSNHESIEKVRHALSIAKELAPELEIDGELQFDTAFCKKIAKQKAPESKIAGDANIFIFPDLNSGNIAYKITQRLGGFSAYGPILQGLDRPMNDLSRGCSAEDIISIACITAIMC